MKKLDSQSDFDKYADEGLVQALERSEKMDDLEAGKKVDLPDPMRDDDEPYKGPNSSFISLMNARKRLMDEVEGNK